MAPTKINNRLGVVAIGSKAAMTHTTKPTDNNGRRSLLKPRSLNGISRMRTLAGKGGIKKTKDRNEVSSQTKNILQEKGFRRPGPVATGKKSVRFKDANCSEKLTEGQRNPLQSVENVQNVAMTAKHSPAKVAMSQFGENFVFEEDPAALASILNNEGVSTKLLQKTQMDESKKEGKSADEFLLLPDGRPSLCRRIPTNRSSIIHPDGSRASIISSRVSAGPGRVARVSNAGIGRSSFINAKRSSVMRSSTRDSFFNFIDRRYSQHANNAAVPPVAGRTSFINPAKPKGQPVTDMHGAGNTKRSDEELQKSLARRVLRTKIEQNLASPALRVPSDRNLLANSPALRVRKTGKTPKKSGLVDQQLLTSPKMKDTIAVALFQDEEITSPVTSRKQTNQPQPRNAPAVKFIPRLKPATQIRQNVNKPKVATSAKPANKKMDNVKSGRHHDNDIKARWVEPQLSPGEELVQPTVLNAENQKLSSTHASGKISAKPSTDTVETAVPPSRKLQKSKRPVSKIPTRNTSQKTNVDANFVLELMYKKLAKIKRRSVQAEFTSVVESVEMSLASTAITEEDEAAEDTEADGIVETVHKEQEAKSQQTIRADDPPKPGMRPWREVLAAESTSPTWKDILSKKKVNEKSGVTQNDLNSLQRNLKATDSTSPASDGPQHDNQKMDVLKPADPVKNPSASEVDKNLRLTYEESLRQIQATEAEKKRIEDDMKQLQLEKLSLEEKCKRKDPPKPIPASISKMSHVKNRLLRVLDTKVVTSSKHAIVAKPDSYTLHPPRRYFGPIVSPKDAESTGSATKEMELPSSGRRVNPAVPVSHKTSPNMLQPKSIPTATMLNAAPNLVEPESSEVLPTNPNVPQPKSSPITVEPKTSPNFVKPESANAFLWQKNDREKKITGGRITHATHKDTPPNLDDGDKCPIMAVISPSDAQQSKASENFSFHSQGKQEKLRFSHQTNPPMSLPTWDPSLSNRVSLSPLTNLIPAPKDPAPVAPACNPTKTCLPSLPTKNDAKSHAGKLPSEIQVDHPMWESILTPFNDFPEFTRPKDIKPGLGKSPPTKPLLEPPKWDDPRDMATIADLVGFQPSGQPIKSSCSSIGGISESMMQNATFGFSKEMNVFEEDSYLKENNFGCTKPKNKNPGIEVSFASPRKYEADNTMEKSHPNTTPGTLTIKADGHGCGLFADWAKHATPDNGFGNLSSSLYSSDDRKKREYLENLPADGSGKGLGISKDKNATDRPNLIMSASPNRTEAPSGFDSPGSWLVPFMSNVAKTENYQSLDILGREDMTKTTNCLISDTSSSTDKIKMKTDFGPKSKIKIDKNGNLITSPEEKKAMALSQQEEIKSVTSSSYHQNASLIHPTCYYGDIPGFSPLAPDKNTPIRNLIDFSFAEKHSTSGEGSLKNPVMQTSYSTEPLVPQSKSFIPEGRSTQDKQPSASRGVLVSFSPLANKAHPGTQGLIPTKDGKNASGLAPTPIKAVRFSNVVADSGSSQSLAKPIFDQSKSGNYFGTPLAPKPIKPPPPQTPAAFRLLRQKLRNSPTPKKNRSRSPLALQSPSRGVAKQSRKKTSFLTSSPYMRSVCTKRFAEALLDEEVALFTCRNLRTPGTPSRRGREKVTSNPLGRVLMEGDDKHFIPLSPIIRDDRPAKSNVIIGSAFSAFSQGT